jgi:hypothetical protein
LRRVSIRDNTCASADDFAAAERHRNAVQLSNANLRRRTVNVFLNAAG